MRRFHITALSVAALIGSAIAAGGCGSEQPQSNSVSDEEARRALAGAPAPLAAVHEQANELLDGGPRAFERRLAELKGYPVVVNRWAAWCDPCRREFPHFQRQALEHGKRVAFLGVDVQDNDGDAAKLLEEFPVTYPSYKDHDLKISAVFNAVTGPPTTAFYDRKGELAYVKQGVYLDEKDLTEDIERYAR
jgi:cytochrome c biogenesis protein CcmG, thiol:disulfide interchange protein DsbE